MNPGSGKLHFFALDKAEFAPANKFPLAQTFPTAMDFCDFLAATHDRSRLSALK